MSLEDRIEAVLSRLLGAAAIMIVLAIAAIAIRLAIKAWFDQ